MNTKTLQTVKSKRTHHLVIASILLIASTILISNTAHASHGQYIDGSGLSFSITYGYYPDTVVYYDAYRPIRPIPVYRHVDNHRYYVVHPDRHGGGGGYKHGNKHHRKHGRGHGHH